ncbi:putative ATP-dependent RNA helicase DDX49 [Lonchura striata]|uniref:RNA helicase n=1 Tax=Lonchura striata TaxID=40157 RepID=A0A218UCI5_9PASE|nr:putative ATP-dependent RNA helicase DDX49 [Lonchura striata domestica]
MSGRRGRDAIAARGRGGMAAFRALGLAPWLAEQARQLGLLRPTPVQAACIPAVLQGRDCLGCAQTGSGKTAAFVLPVLQLLSEDPYGIFCLVLTPTRELAYQIAEQFRVLGKPLGLKDCVVLDEADRLLEQGSADFSADLELILGAVLDEADRLLEQGSADFSADLELILGAVPARRQTLLVRTVEGLEQRYLLVPEALKDAYLVHLVQSFQDQHEDWAIIIFTKTCKDCQVLNMMLRKFSFPSVALHSMMKQKQRFAALAKFKSSIFKILIATDVAARGLDIPAVQVVINHNTPGLPRIYIHRVGRTARAGRKGLALTLVTQYDIHLVHAIEEEIKLQLQEFPVQEQEVLQILTQVSVTRRECEIELEGADFDEKKEINKRKQLILEGKDPERAARGRAELAGIRRRNRECREKARQSLERRRQLRLSRKRQRGAERRRRRMDREQQQEQEQ